MRTFFKPVILAAALLLMAAPVFAELLDRIVVVIDDSFIITLSDIRKERAIQSALGSDAGSDDAIADALVEKHLVEREITEFHEIAVPEDLVTERLRSIRIPPGLSEQDLKDAMIGELRRRQFIVERFQQFVRVSDEELLKYFNETYAPELRRRGEAVPTPEQGMQLVRENVIAIKTDDEVRPWLMDLRRRSVIEKISK